jgi:hypothetical protein
MRLTARLFVVTFFAFFVLSLFITPSAHAQTLMPTVTPETAYTSDNTINAEPGVPLNQHTRVQAIFIDLLSATSCVLTGIDPIDKNKACLGINPKTGQLSYAPAAEGANGQTHVGGLLGISTNMVSVLYTPTISTHDYIHYMASNFGIVKKAYAQQDVGYGFSGLTPLLTLWQAIRNMAYFLLMIAFIVLGLGIMLRVKADPRTVMTLQNQIPRIIICILLVTFSYAIAGVLIDMMWLTTYIGIDLITKAGGATTNPTVPGQSRNSVFTGDPKSPNFDDHPLSNIANANLLQTPVTYFNEVFRTWDEPGSVNVDSGIGHIADEVSYSLGGIVKELIDQVGLTDALCPTSIGGFIVTVFTLGVPCIIAGLIQYIAAFLLWIVIVIIVLKTLFQVWFTLLKAYTYIILYTIAAPFFIVMGLMPGQNKTLGFEKWLRSMVANLAVFPLTAFMFVLGRLFLDLFSAQTGPAGTLPTQTGAAGGTIFITPLIGQPNISGFLGVLIAFGLLLMTPTLLVQLQEALKVPGNKYGGAAIGGLIAAGAAAPKALYQNQWKRAWQHEDAYHNAGFMRSTALGKGVGEHKNTPGIKGTLLRTQARARSLLFGGGRKKDAPSAHSG